MFSTAALVALGGAIGAAARFLVGVGIVRVVGATGFPVAILSVNVIGSFLMGVFVVMAAQRGAAAFGPFVLTGVLGGFTTFSAFSLETVSLLERGQIGAGLLYVALSVGLSVMGLTAGLWLARGVLS